MSEAQTIDQAPAQSIEDRIFAHLEPDTDQPADPSAYDGKRIEEPDEEPEAESEEVEIEYEGERFRIPKKLEKGILQERDYTQKTQQIAEQRRLLEHSVKALESTKLEREFQQSVAQEMQQIQLLDSYLQQLKATDVNNLPMEDGFKHWMQLQQLKEQRDAIEKSVQARRVEYDQKYKAHVESLRKSARDVLASQIPGLTDEVIGQMEAHAKTMGYTDADIELFREDPRASAVLIKAMKYDQLQASKSAAVQRVSPTVKPGSSNPMPQQVRDKLNFRKAMKSSSSSQDKARLIERRLGDMF